MTSNRNRGSLLRKILPKEEATRPRGVFRSSTEPLLSSPYRFLVGGSLLCASSSDAGHPGEEGFPVILSVLFFFSYSHFVITLSFVVLPHIPHPLSSLSLHLLIQLSEGPQNVLIENQQCCQYRAHFLRHLKAISCYVLV